MRHIGVAIAALLLAMPAAAQLLALARTFAFFESLAARR